ncbi:MAG: Ig-like domain-containing protein, partial [Clostridiales bacterium]|nr:Ig-like domain-containing protein [Clostridiales bacterium]
MIDKFRHGFRLALMLVLVCAVFTAGRPITARAAAQTSVKVLSVGNSYTVSGYTKVTSGTKSVATTQKKSSKKYTVKAVKTGRTTLCCYNKSGKLVKKIYLLATDDNSLSYDNTSLTLINGKTKTISAAAPSGCSVVYSSSKKSIAAVNSNGKITAKKAGTAQITVKVT